MDSSFDPSGIARPLAPVRPLPEAAARPAQVRDVQARARKRRWPARLDLLQSASGLFLALFLVGHMFFVSSILIRGRDAHLSGRSASAIAGIGSCVT